MTNQIYALAKLRKPSFLQRLLGQYPEQNIVIEINNILATQSILSIQEETLNSISSKIQVNIFDLYKLNFLEFYVTYLNACLKNHIITDLQVEELEHLKGLFKLDYSVIEKIHVDIAGNIYQNEYREVIKNKYLAQKEKLRLNQLKTDLKLAIYAVENIEKICKKEIIQPYFTELLNFETLSPNKEKEFESIIGNLEIEVPIAVITEIKRLRQYWEWENQDIERIETFVRLQKEEVCFFSTQSEWYEFLAKSSSDTIQKYSLGKRISISKSVLKSRYLLDLKFADIGTLYLTNKRIFFVGDKNHSIKLDEVYSFGVYNNGIEINKLSGRSIFLSFKDVAPKVAIILSRIAMENLILNHNVNTEIDK